MIMNVNKLSKLIWVKELIIVNITKFKYIITDNFMNVCNVNQNTKKYILLLTIVNLMLIMIILIISVAMT